MNQIVLGYLCHLEGVFLSNFEDVKRLTQFQIMSCYFTPAKILMKPQYVIKII